MVELRDALSQIAEIRQQMAKGQVFRGYRSVTAAFSGVVAVVTGVVQAVWLPKVGGETGASGFVVLWIGAAVMCLVVMGVEMFLRRRRLGGGQRELVVLAVEQFVPPLVAGGMLTWVFWEFLAEHAWMLPGLWMVIFALGVFASVRLLPREIFGVAGFYLLAGVVVLILSHRAGGGWAFSPWLMAGVFGMGQFAVALILYVRLERGS
ncbi:MAG: hypothetical protein FWD53_04595 [Phycisphaerales bacterium]|nr:hypothetical protein [Phycisphaerales bacterium]